MKIKNKIIYKNNIPKKYLRSGNNLNKKYSLILRNIYDNLNNLENSFHTLSDRYKFNFKIKDIKKFKKFKTVVVIGMGGSILGAEAIYHFL